MTFPFEIGAETQKSRGEMCWKYQASATSDVQNRDCALSGVTSEAVFFPLSYVDKKLSKLPLLGLRLSQASTLGRKLGAGGVD